MALLKTFAKRSAKKSNDDLVFDKVTLNVENQASTVVNRLQPTLFAGSLDMELICTQMLADR